MWYTRANPGYRTARRSAGTPGVLLSLAFASLVPNGCAGNLSEAIATVQHYVFEPFPNATVGEMVSGFFGNPKWSAIKRKDGFFKITVTGTVEFRHRAAIAELTFLGSRRLSTVVPFSLTIDSQKMTDVTTYEFLKRMHSDLFPDSKLLIGEWVSEEDYPRAVHFLADGTFKLRSWPWAIGGSYQVLETNKTIILQPDRPIDRAIRELLFTYSFNDHGDLILTDPDADVFLLSEPLVFKRTPRPQFERLPHSRLDPAGGTGSYAA